MRTLARAILLIGFALITGCEDSAPPTLPPATPGGGFIIETLFNDNGITSTAPGVAVIGDFQADLPGGAGDPARFTVITDSQGLAPAVGKRAPASWKFTWVNGPPPAQICANEWVVLDVPLDDIRQLWCNITIVVLGTSSGFPSHQIQ